MPFELRNATEADALRSAEIERLAYAPLATTAVLFPGPMPADVMNHRAAELAKLLRDDPTCRWLKVVETDIEPNETNDQMIGFAQWNIRTAGEPLPGPRTPHPGVNDEAFEALFGAINRMRAKTIGDQPHLHLKSLHVDPKYERKGAGQQMISWGVEEAKKAGLPAFLEASQVGYPLYLRCGFREVDRISVDFNRWGLDEIATTVAMVKDP
ncbi:acyl-CoA N-acyltransferase [Xylariaceae sp. FL1019]|nr:acyl-CoA N-acyltransferase [Xylariaceae sp. FL1019]